MFRTDDPERDLERWLDEQARIEAKLPRCSECGEPICDDIYYEIGGKIYCQECLDENFLRNTEDYMNDF
jgi:formylmethanofuran dehydrogenase subunit E